MTNDTCVFPVTELTYAEFTWLLRDVPPEFLNEHEYAALTALHARGNSKRPSYVTLAANMKTSDSTAKRAVKSLLEKGWIEILAKGGPTPGGNTANVYGIRGVPKTVRDWLSSFYAANPDGNEWFFRWCQTDTTVVSEGHQGSVCETQRVVSERHTKSKRTREKTSDKSSDKTPAPPVAVTSSEDKSLDGFISHSPTSRSGAAEQEAVEDSDSQLNPHSSAVDDEQNNHNVSHSDLGFSDEKTTGGVTQTQPYRIHAYQNRVNGKYRLDDGSPKRSYEIDGGYLDDDYIWCLTQDNEIYR